MDQTTMLLIISTIGFLGTVLKIVYPLIVAKLTKEQLSAMQIATEIAMFAAENIISEVGQGVSKKEFVKNFLIKKFPKISESDMDILIQSTGEALGIFK
jgi:glutamate racemase